jgi:hypothetical protein
MRQKIERKAAALYVFFVFVVFVCPWNALGDALVGIESVYIAPSFPTETDSITFDISGWASKTDSWVEYDEYFEDGSLLQLDLYVNTDPFTSSSEWTYSRPILTLPANTYTLELNAYDYQANLLRDTYLFEFTVIPEPTSLFLFGTGLYIIRIVSKRKI